MNILFLDSIEPATYGGMEEWIRLVAAGLAERGHAVSVAGRPGSEFLRRIESDLPGVTTLALDISGDFNPATIARLKKFLDAREIDLITVNFNKDLRLGGIAARLDGRPAVIWSVGLDITKDSFGHRLLTPRLVDGTIVPSLALKKQITRHGYLEPDTVEVIPIGIDDREFSRPDPASALRLREKYKMPPDVIVAVTVARFVDQKGHRHLVDAAPGVIRSNPAVRFLLLGDGPLRGELAERVAGYGLNEHFIFAGMLDDLDLELAGSDLMVHPSVDEPFGIAILEGMRAGLPVVASRIGGIPEVVEENSTAVLVTPSNPRELAEAIRSIVSSQQTRLALGRAGQERWRRNFRRVTMIDRIETYFRSHLKTGARSDG